MAMGVSALTHSPSSSSISSVSSVASSVGGRPSRSGLVRDTLVCVWEWGGDRETQLSPDLLWFQASISLEFLNKDESIYFLTEKLTHLHLLLFLYYRFVSSLSPSLGVKEGHTEAGQVIQVHTGDTGAGQVL